MDWIVAQPWSDGTIGGWGNSYTATTNDWFAERNHTALKAGMSRFPVMPHPNRSKMLVKNRFPLRKGSSDNLHPTPNAGNVPHRFAGPNTEEPSLLSVKPSR